MNPVPIRFESYTGEVVHVGESVTIAFDVDGELVQREYQNDIFQYPLKRGDEVLAAFQFTLLSQPGYVQRKRNVVPLPGEF